MNKLRSIKIYEIQGKVHPIEKFIIDMFSDIKKEINRDNIINYRKNGTLYMTIDLETNIMYLSHTYVWIIIQNKYDMKYKESRDILQYLLEKHLHITSIIR